ncbi:MAG: hypothetical protein HY664_02150 [Chloroflexi bacterium]|nr:hypothetical protein [Chloroflexota bacterium]
MKELLGWLSRLVGKKVLVVGDLCLDEYIIGQAQRLSREAPVPVLEFQRRFTVPGAAANPALNIQALGGEALVVGTVGDDMAGYTLRQHLEEKGIPARGIIIDASRPTTVKTRVLAEVSLHFPQQMVRLDHQERGPLNHGVRDQIVTCCRESFADVDAILVSDYKSGVVERDLITALLPLAKAQGKIITVDSQGDLFKFKGFTLIKCNQSDAESTLRRSLNDVASFKRWGQNLQRRLATSAMVITKGSDGMSFIDDQGNYAHIPATNRSEVFDVTGAGDTVIATLTLALAAEVPLLAATHLANYAAGLVVRKLGNAAPTQEEIKKAILLDNDTEEEPSSY